MFYTFELYSLIAFVVFAFAGLLILTFAIWKEATDYARALHAGRERLAISRTTSRNHDATPFDKA